MTSVMSDARMNVSITLRPQTLKKYMNPIFIETGSFDGRCIQMAHDVGFEYIIGIELDKNFANFCESRFISIPNIHIYYGDSTALLWNLIRKLENNVTFWLDAHYRTVKGVKRVPLLDELQIISKHPNCHNFTILIDDRRNMGKNMWSLVSENIVLDHLNKIFPKLDIVYEDSNAARNDIIVARNLS